MAVIEERNGFTFESGNSASMNKAILLLYNSPELRNKFYYNNISDAAQFSVEIAVSRMADIYKKYMKQ